MSVPGGYRHREPIPAAPFVAWCEQRRAQIARSLDQWPGLTHGAAEESNPLFRLLAELGWADEAGHRRYHRWTHDLRRGVVERRVVEDALLSAGVDFYDLYPDLDVDSGPVRPLGIGGFMTEREILAAHAVYVRGQLTIGDLADRLWERFGYASPAACDWSLRHAWRARGLSRRRCAATRDDGAVCGGLPLKGMDVCAAHSGRRPGWVASEDLIACARARHEAGEPFLWIARGLLARTPLRHPTDLACRLASIARAQGWHGTSDPRALSVAGGRER